MSSSANGGNGKQNSPYQFFMLGLCLYALAALAIMTLVDLDPEMRRILEIADFGVCILFFADFLNTLVKSENRLKYFMTWGWLDLVSSIPSIDFLRWGRFGRVIRITRVLRGVKAARHLSVFLLTKRTESVLLSAGLLSILMVICSSIAMIHFERDAIGATIKTAEDSLWWAVMTITTIGNSDKSPVTSEGRIVSVVLMIAGVALLGTFSGYIASWFLAPQEAEQDKDLDKIKHDLEEIRRAVIKEDKSGSSSNTEERSLKN